MINKIIYKFCCYTSIIFLICGCAINPDPGQGGFIDGLVGIYSGSYNNRIEQRKKILEQLQEETIQLEKKLSSTNVRSQTLAEKKLGLVHDLLNLKKNIQEQESYLQEIKQQKKKIERSKEAEMEKTLEKLIQEKRRLQQQIEELGAM